MQIAISEKIKYACPAVKLAVMQCDVHNSSTPDPLWNELQQTCSDFSSKFQLEDINKRATIAATRAIYKALGKDPNRYRPSAEALSRRIVRGLPLYRVSTLVDIINIVSIESGFSIGGFDASKVQGDLLLDVGTADDKFEAIGRGLLNIEGLPVYRDGISGIGTPTSDCERTKLSEDTLKLIVVINGYSGADGFTDAVNKTEHLLQQYAKLSAAKIDII